MSRSNLEPVALFIRVRNLRAALLVSVGGWLFLLLSPSIEIPFQEHSVPTPLIWPGLAALVTQLVSVSEVPEWETRSVRNLALGQVTWTLSMAVINVVVASALVPVHRRVQMITWYLALSGVGLIAVRLLGDRAW